MSEHRQKGFRTVAFKFISTLIWQQVLGPNDRRCGLIIWGSFSSNVCYDFQGDNLLSGFANGNVGIDVAPTVIPRELVEGCITGPIFAMAPSSATAQGTITEFYYL